MNVYEKHAEEAVHVYSSEAKRLIQLSLFYRLLKADGTKLYLQSLQKKNMGRNFKLFLFDILFC